ncbi:MAG: hypothetical protein IT580_04370, partial [Verrucomicrobiales bacterium]|nr:hypothetical protein [Verrucomicrobiales bacterium]
LPATIPENSTYGASIPIDLGDVPTGLYTAILEFGMFKPDANGKYTNGRFFTYTQPYAVVNSRDGLFGAGWGMGGLRELYLGDGGVLLVDGNGMEEIFLAPQTLGQPFTALSSADYAELRQREDGTFILRDKYATEYEFNRDGKMVLMRDRNGLVTTYSWAAEQLLSIRDPVGLVTEFKYSGAQVSAVIDPAGRRTEFGYAGDKNLASITDPDGSRRTFAYGDGEFEHIMVSQVFKRGNDPSETSGLNFVETIQYNEFGRVVGGTRLDGKKFTLTAAQMLHVVKTEDALDPLEPAKTVLLSKLEGEDLEYRATATYKGFNQRLITYTMTGFGQFTSSKDEADGIKTENKRRPGGDGYVTKVTNPEGYVSEYEYDLFGNLIKRTDYPQGTPISDVYTYDMRWSLIRIHEDGAGRTYTNTFDSRGNVTSTRIEDTNAPTGSPDTVTLNFAYNDLGLITTSSDGEGRTTRFTYDGYGRTTAVIYADGARRTYEYADLTGNPTTSTDEVGVVIRSTFDPMNRQKEKSVSKEGVGFSWSMDYDAEGNLIREVNSRKFVTKHTYEVLDRVASSTIAAGSLDLTYRYAYEARGLTTPYTVPTNAEWSYRLAQDPAGYTTAQVFDRFGHMIFDIDALGHQTKFIYNKAGYLIQRIQSDTGVLKFTVDGRGRVLEQTGPESESVSYAYDGANRMIREVVANDSASGGNQITLKHYNLFDLPGLITSATDAVTQLDYDRSGNVIAKTEARGTPAAFTTTFKYDDRNREISRTLGGTATIHTAYWDDGSIRSVSDPRQSDWVTRYEYDVLKRLTRETDAAGGVWITVRDGEGNITERSDPRGVISLWKQDFDGANRLTQVRDPLGNLTKNEYDGAGNLIRVTDARGYVTSKTYDARHDVLSITDAEKGISRMTYDAMGRLATSTDPRGDGYITTFKYDKSGRLVLRKDALAQETVYEYDRAGNRIRETGPQGARYRTEWTYDRGSRVLSMTRAPGTADEVVERNTYNALNQVVSRTDGLGRVTQFEYDALQHQKSMTAGFGSPEAATWRYVYDKAGNLLSVTDPRGDYYTTVSTYDALGRLKDSVTPVGTPADGRTAKVTYTYDGAGNMVAKTDPRNASWTLGFEYDGLNRLTVRIDQAGVRTRLVYDAVGNLTDVISADGRTTHYDFDGLRRQVRMVDSDGATTSLFYDAVGNLLRQTGPRSNAEGGPYVFEYSYDRLSRRLSAVDPEKGVTFFTYDAGNNVTLTVDVRGYETTFDYDFLNRVVKVTRSASEGVKVTEAFGYDRVGNKVSYTNARGAETTYVYDALNRLRRLVEPPANEGGSRRITTYEYDAVGNLLSMTDPRGAYYVTKYAHDAANRVVREERAQGTAADPQPAAVFITEYDNAGQVVAVYDPRGRDYFTRYTYDRQSRVSAIERSLASPLGGTGVSRESFTYDPVGKMLSRTDGRGKTTSYTYNARGWIETITDPEGNKSTLSYDESGNLIARSDTDAASGTVRSAVYTYDGLGRRTSESLNGTFVTKYEFDASGNLLFVRGPLANAEGTLFLEARTYDGLNRLTSVTDRAGFTRRFDYDAAGDLIREIDGRGFVQTMAYTPAGFLARLEEPSGTETAPGPRLVSRFTYDEVGNAVTVIDPRGEAFAITTIYDAQNRAIQTTTPIGAGGAAAIEFTKYDGMGNVVETRDALGRVAKQVFDAQNRRVQLERTVSSGGVSKTLLEISTYDEVGNLVSQRTAGGEGHVTRFVYDGLNRLVKTTDAAGQVAEWLYDRWGNLLEDRGLAGKVVYTYDALNRVVTTTDERGAVTRMEYEGISTRFRLVDAEGRGTVRVLDGLGRPVLEIDALGGETVTQFDAAGNITSIVDKRGIRTEYTWDARNLLLEERRAVGTAAAVAARYVYDELGRLLRATDFRGDFFRTDYTYDGLGRRLTMRTQVGSESSPQVAETAWEYDAVGNVLAEIDPRGFRTEFVYDSRNLLLETREADGTEDAPKVAVTLREYDDSGLLVTLTTPLGHVTTFDYDLVGRVISKTVETGVSPEAPEGELTWRWSYTYESHRLKIEETDPLGVTVKTFHDANGRPIRVEDPRTGVTTIDYDLVGNVLKRSNGRLSTSYAYDALQRRVSMTDGDGKTTRYELDATGNLLRETDPLGNTVSHVYDELGRRITTIDAAGGRSEFRYDAQGNLVSTTDAARTVTTFVFDAGNRLVSETTRTGTRSYQYDEMGNLVRATDRRGLVLTYDYDRANRRVGESWINAAGDAFYTVESTYDLEGRLVSISDEITTVTREYSDDALNRLVSEKVEYAEGALETTVSWVTDALGRPLIARLEEGDSLVVRNLYTYDSLANRLARVVQDGTAVITKRVDFAYQPDVPVLASIARYASADASASVAVSTFTINARGLITRLEHRIASGAILTSYDLAYFDDGRLSTMTSPQDVATYAYDVRRQVTAVQHSDAAFPDESYTYDAAGNRIGSHHQSGVLIGADNQITATSDSTFAYDNEGNLTRRVDTADREVYEFSWDHRNRLTAVTVKNLVGDLIRTITYQYDGLNRRVSESVNIVAPSPRESTRYFVYDGASVWAEYLDADGVAKPAEAEVQWVYLRGLTADMLLAQDGGTSDSVLWILADASGNVRDVINSTGGLEDHIRLDAFGIVVSRTNGALDQRHFLAGREYDSDTGLYFMRARYYDPALGRFISQDPLGVAGGNNRYGYAGNDPVNRADPTGMFMTKVENLTSRETPFVDADAQGSRAQWISFWSFGHASYDVQTVQGEDGKFALVGVTDQALVKGSSEDNLANLGLFFYGLVNKGFYNMGKELLTMAADAGRTLGVVDASQGFQSQLFRMSENIHGGNDFLRAVGGLIAAPFVGLWSLGTAIASGDPEAAGEQLAGALPLPSKLGRLGFSGSKWAAIKGSASSIFTAFVDNLKPPLLNETKAGWQGIRSLSKEIAGGIQSGRYKNNVLVSLAIAEIAIGKLGVTGAAWAGTKYVARTGVNLLKSGIERTVNRAKEIYRSTFNEAAGKLEHLKDTRYGTPRDRAEARIQDMLAESDMRRRQQGMSQEQMAKERKLEEDVLRKDFEESFITEALTSDIKDIVREDVLRKKLKKGMSPADEAAARQYADKAAADAVTKFEAQAFNVANPEHVPQLDTRYRSKISDKRLLKMLRADDSIRQGFANGDPTARSLVYLLREAKEWGPLRKTLVQQIREGRTLQQFQDMGAVDTATFSALEKAAKTFGESQELTVFGSFGTDLVTFANRHMLGVATREGKINLKALMATYGRGGEAMVLGRIIPDLGKKGGPFSDSGDFDFAVFRQRDNSLPGGEAVVWNAADQTLNAEKLRAFLPDDKKGLPADFDYAKYENEVLRGFETSYRGRARFGFDSETGSYKFLGRVQSVIYGEGGAVLRDFPEFFTRGNFVQKPQAHISHPFNLENVERIGWYT